VISAYVHKGSRIYLEGRKRTKSWDDKQTGATTVGILSTPTKFLDSKGNSNGTGNGQSEEAASDDTANTEDLSSRNGSGRSWPFTSR
jgi:single-stranded DNA-binding protein